MRVCGCVSVCECVHVLRVPGLGGGLQCPLSHVCLLTRLFVALAFPRKMTSVYHCDWHCLASPSFFLFVPTHTPACPPPLPTITLRRSPETCTLIGYTQPAGTVCIRRRRSNCISVLYDCHTSVLLRSPEGPGEAGRRAGAAKSRVCAVNARRCGGSTTGKLLHCAGRRHGNAGFLPGKVSLPGMMKRRRDGRRQRAAEERTLPESMFHTSRAYAHSGRFAALW